MNTWLIADTHFSHDNIIRFENRPFSSTDEMDELMIDNWNALVKPDDTVWHLGDFALTGGDDGKLQRIFNRLNGRKNLIIGNHDKKTRTKWREIGFRQIEKKLIVLSGLLLSHYPYPLNEYENLCKQQLIIGNVHGHVHSKTRHLIPTIHFCISVELTDYKPIALEDAVSHFKTFV